MNLPSSPVPSRLHRAPANMLAGDEPSTFAMLAPEGQQLVQRMQKLASGAASLLGLDAHSAAAVARDATITIGGHAVAMLPMIDVDGVDPTLLLVVDAGHAFDAADPKRFLQLSSQASGLLAVFSAAIGVSAESGWVLYRSLPISSLRSQGLAEALVSSVRLADMVFSDAQEIDR